MSDRDLRKSTIKATEETKSREEARHSKQLLKKQRAVYSELIAEQEREIPESSDSQSNQVKLQLVLKKLTEISILMMKKVHQMNM